MLVAILGYILMNMEFIFDIKGNWESRRTGFGLRGGGRVGINLVRRFTYWLENAMLSKFFILLVVV